MFIHAAQVWQFLFFPCVFMMIEKLIQKKRIMVDVKIIDSAMTARDVLYIRMKLIGTNKKFNYKAGQYLFLCCPEINETEYHPFTISSAPDEEYFSCHIRCRNDMDWTYALRGKLGHVADPLVVSVMALQNKASAVKSSKGNIRGSADLLVPVSLPISLPDVETGLVMRVNG
jgi:hypothetical protein